MQAIERGTAAELVTRVARGDAVAVAVLDDWLRERGGAGLPRVLSSGARPAARPLARALVGGAGWPPRLQHRVALALAGRALPAWQAVWPGYGGARAALDALLAWLDGRGARAPVDAAAVRLRAALADVGVTDDDLPARPAPLPPRPAVEWAGLEAGRAALAALDADPRAAAGEALRCVARLLVQRRLGDVDRFPTTKAGVEGAIDVVPLPVVAVLGLFGSDAARNRLRWLTFLRAWRRCEDDTAPELLRWSADALDAALER